MLRTLSWPAVLFAVILLALGVAPALAETIDISDDHGGSVAQYAARWSALEARGVSVRIVGPCQYQWLCG